MCILLMSYPAAVKHKTLSLKTASMLSLPCLDMQADKRRLCSQKHLLASMFERLKQCRVKSSLRKKRIAHLLATGTKSKPHVAVQPARLNLSSKALGTDFNIIMDSLGPDGSATRRHLPPPSATTCHHLPPPSATTCHHLPSFVSS